ncbi:MAG: ArsA family ATPase [Cyanobacteria bacterium J083]|nr:MAG: ArsA family ATPase [Cyanobacteria bacterium J083]
MSFILTFLGKGGVGRSTVAIAAAKRLASQGERVLLVSADPSSSFDLLLGVSLSQEKQEIETNLSAVQLRSTHLLEVSWEQVKQLEAEYLRSPTLKNVYGQELGILPGMDEALALNAIREYDQSGKYDVIIYDGANSFATLRMFGIPEMLNWYIRRFSQVLSESDVVKALSPFIQPITSAILNVGWSSDDLNSNSTTKANQMLEEGQKAVSDPRRVAAYLVTTTEPTAKATAKYLWGSAQQINLTVGGLILNQAEISEEIAAEFAQIPVSNLPKTSDWLSLGQALPDFRQAVNSPKPLTIDSAKGQVKVFLPGFTKQQVKLTQYGTELTVEAGDQRHNIYLPPTLKGKSVKGAKFQDNYLIISL